MLYGSRLNCLIYIIKSHTEYYDYSVMHILSFSKENVYTYNISNRK